MFTNSFPYQVDWLKLIQQQASMSVALSVQELPRFSGELLQHADEPIELKLQFAKDDEQRSCLHGQVNARVTLECQRCLQALQHVIDSEFTVYIVTSEGQEQALPRGLDAVVVNGEMLDLHALVEDELLLQLPLTCYHEIQACDPAFRYNEPAIEIVEPAETKPNPFAVLESLKKKS